MSVLRNLLIVGLLVCVAYNGYVIYRNQLAQSPADSLEVIEQAPLFSAEAFTELAENRSQVSVQEVPTVVTPEEAASPKSTVANPVLETAAASLPVLPVSAKKPVNGKGSRFTTATGDAPKDEPISAEAAETKPMVPDNITPKVLSFEDAWAEIEKSEASFTLATALKQINKLAQRADLTDQQREQVTDKGDELAEMVIFAPNKHLAKPAMTFLPDMKLEEIAANHQIPEAFLRKINGWSKDDNPTPGDSVKVVEGPVAMHVDLPAKQIRLTVGELYAGRISIGQNDLTVPEASSMTLKEVEAIMELSIGDVSVAIDQDNVAPPANALLVTAEDWNLLAALADESVTIGWTEEKQPEAPVVAEAETETEQAMVAESAKPQPMTADPVDALKLEIFTPAEEVVQGKPVKYGIEVTNLSDQPSEMAQVVINLSEGIEPIKLEGQPGRIAPGQALFEPVSIEPGESLRMTVTIETSGPGQFLVRPELQCAKPETKYATEVELRVIAAPPVSAEPEPEPKSEGNIPPQPKDVMAEIPFNPAKDIR